MKKVNLLVIPLMAISFLVSCSSKPEPTPQEDVTFKADTTVTLDESKKIVNIALDWTPTDHSVECGNFTFTLKNQRITSFITPGEVGSRPLNLTIEFDEALSTDDTGDLKFRFDDRTAKKGGESKIEGINVKLPRLAEHSISMITAGTTITPEIFSADKDYVGTITIDSNNANDMYDILPNSFDDVKLINSNGDSIAADCIYVRADDLKSATLTIPAKDLTDDISVNVPLENSSYVWHYKSNWWEYCSNGTAGEQAIKADIGQEVKVTINSKVHKIRLIGVDHIDVDGETPEAHCTFEFVNVFTKTDGEADTTCWDNREGDQSTNYDFPNSTLNDFLNNNDDCILSKLPTGLKEAIKQVNKRVGTGNDYSTKTPYQTKLFPLAHDEITDKTAPNVPSGEGATYAYYKTHNKLEDLIKETVDGSSARYWLRSPNSGSSATVWNSTAWFINGGYIRNERVYNSVAIAPAFCI